MIFAKVTIFHFASRLRETEMSLFPRLYYFSVSRYPRSKSKIVKFVKIMAYFSISKRTCDSTDVPASIYDRKIAVRYFHTIKDILRSLSLTKYHLKGRNAPIRYNGNRGVNLPKNLGDNATK